MASLTLSRNLDEKQPNIVNHSLILLEGTVSETSDSASRNSNTSSELETELTSENSGQKGNDLLRESYVLVNHNGLCQKWPVVNGKFKAFVKLNEGENDVEIVCPELGSQKKLLVQRIKPEKQTRFVRVVYIKCSDSDGKFDAPENTKNDIDTAIQKIKFNALLLQTFTAVDMYRHGFGLQTFQLEEDEYGEVVVHVFDSKLTTEKAHSMSGSELYSWFHAELTDSPLYNPNCKLLSFMSCTHYDPPEDLDMKKTSQYVKAHTALGGGQLGLFGTGGLHTWASGVEDLVKCFTDTTEIDKTKLFDDSAGRGTYWANYSTTLGATMHELGHCFDLSHTPEGIMGRGFDDMNHFVTMQATKKQPDDITEQLGGGMENDEVLDGAHMTTVTVNDMNDGTQPNTEVQDVSGEMNAKSPGKSTIQSPEVGGDSSILTTEVPFDGSRVIALSEDNTQITMQIGGSEIMPGIAGDCGESMPAQPHTSTAEFTTTEVHHSTETSYSSMTTESVMVTHASKTTTQKVFTGSSEFTTVTMVTGHGNHHSTRTSRTTTQNFAEAFSTSTTEIVTSGDGSMTDGGSRGTELATMIQAQPHVDTISPTVIPINAGCTHGTLVSAITEVPFSDTGVAMVTPNDGTVGHAHEHRPASEIKMHDGPGSVAVYGATSNAREGDGTKAGDTTVELMQSGMDGTGLASDIFVDHRAHWYRSSAVVLHYHKWFNVPNQAIEANEFILQVNWSSSVKGPVGNGGGGQKNQTFFDDLDWCNEYGLTIAGYAVYHGEYVHAIEPLTTSPPHGKLKDNPIHGRVDDKCTVSFFIMEDTEHLTSIEIHAGAWVDGIRFHTNLKSSDWFGGCGGNWNRLQASNGERIMGIFGTFGSYLGCLGIHVGRPTLEKSKDQGSLEIESSLGIRLVELREGDEMMKFWEFTQENPPSTFRLPSELLENFKETLDKCSIFVLDDGGNVCTTGLYGYKKIKG